MASLLSKFRIDYSSLKMIPDVSRRPRDSTLAYFNKLIEPFTARDDSDDSCEYTHEDGSPGCSLVHSICLLLKYIGIFVMCRVQLNMIDCVS